eukprot:TRINITY_DN11089_c0_g1_i1.p1 TRINITY_DN11089_c0_g1~~TRINITY_DN11089_c0_g1_i1.p1  ORF type:complete len:662 (+),score=149.14 TRINITY_DN11089_c0_g1_i1:29-2014(+)
MATTKALELVDRMLQLADMIATKNRISMASLQPALQETRDLLQLLEPNVADDLVIRCLDKLVTLLRPGERNMLKASNSGFFTRGKYAGRLEQLAKQLQVENYSLSAILAMDVAHRGQRDDKANVLHRVRQMFARHAGSTLTHPIGGSPSTAPVDTAVMQQHIEDAVLARMRTMQTASGRIQSAQLPSPTYSTISDPVPMSAPLPVVSTMPLAMLPPSSPKPAASGSVPMSPSSAAAALALASVRKLPSAQATPHLETGRPSTIITQTPKPGSAKPQRSFSQRMDEAHSGDAAAQFASGKALRLGDGVPRDSVGALRWLRLAGTGGHAEALNELGMMTLLGEGCSSDVHLAARYFQDAIARGSSEAMVNLGSLYELGPKDWPQNLLQAAELYKRAVDRGNARALNNYACLLLNGRGVEKNVDDAVHYLCQAIALDNSNALFNLAVYYENNGGQSDARQLYAAAAQRGHVGAMCAQAFICVSEARFTDALVLLQTASDRGSTEAVYLRGLLYERGHGVPRDDLAAFRLYLNAADRGHELAALHTARLLYSGAPGVIVDRARAAQYYMKAAEAGNAEAALNLAIMFEDGVDVPFNPQRALHLYRQAADGGNSMALYCMARMHESGRGVKLNKDLALLIYQQAKDAGVTAASKKIAFLLSEATAQ